MMTYKKLLIAVFIFSILSFNTAEAFGGFGSFVKKSVGGAVSSVVDFGTDTLISPILSTTKAAVKGVSSVLDMVGLDNSLTNRVVKKTDEATTNLSLFTASFIGNSITSPLDYAISPLYGQLKALYDSLQGDLTAKGNSGVNLPKSNSYAAAGAYTGSGGPTTDRGCGRYEGEGGFLWKPVSESNGNLVVLLPSSMTGLTDRGTANVIRGGQILETGSFAGDEHNGGREHYRFGQAGYEYGRGVEFKINLKTGGSESWFIPNDFSASGDKGCIAVTSSEFFDGLGQNVENNQEELDIEIEDFQDSLSDLDIDEIYSNNFDVAFEGLNTELNSVQNDLDRNRDDSVSRNSDELSDVISSVLDNFESKGYFETGSPNYIDEDSLRNTLFDYYDQILEVQVLDPTTQLPPGLEDKMDIQINPVNPRPGEEVSIKIQSYSFDSTDSYFIWIKDGEVIEKGIGASDVSFKLDDSGLPEGLEIIIEKKNGGKISKFIEIKPSEVDIIYEPNTYTHPFYDGKPVFTHESNVRFIAIPSVLGDSGEKESISSFNYKWLVDGKPDNGQSGAGENTFIYQSSFISEPVRVSVQISSLISDFYTQKTVEVSPESPITLIYEDNPLNGIVYEKAITGSIPLDKKEVRLKAVPLFFSKDGEISFEWLMNNSFINENFGDTIILRSEDDQSGTANIIINTENLNTRLQNDRNSFNIIFNNE